MSRKPWNARGKAGRSCLRSGHVFARLFDAFRLGGVMSLGWLLCGTPAALATSEWEAPSSPPVPSLHSEMLQPPLPSAPASGPTIRLTPSPSGFWRQPSPMAAEPTIPLVPVESVQILNGRLEIGTPSGSRVITKSRFIMSNPSRLVVDLANAKLALQETPPLPRSLGSVPIQAIRFGQFTTDTVRIVIETPEPERLTLSNMGNLLTLSGEPGSGMISRISHFLFGEPRPVASAPTRQPQTATARPTPYSPNSSGPRTPNAYGSTVYRSGTATGNPYSSASPMTAYHPGLENLHRLGMPPGMPTMQGVPSGLRARIIDIAREQLGLSKDTNRDYINQTFSLGRDEEWCADFASSILEWAGGSPWGHLSRVQDIYEWAMANQRVTDRPEPANLVIFSYRANSFDHVAFIESINFEDNTITTIGGNEGYAAAAYKTSGTVARSTYKLDDKRILGFVDPIFPTNRLSQN